MTRLQGPAGPSEAAEAVAVTADVMGGLDVLRSIATRRVVAVGERFEPEQALSPGAEPRLMGRFESTLTHDLVNDRVRVESSRETVYPVTVRAEFTEIIDGDTGFVNGADSWMLPSETSPMSSARVAALRKTLRLASPLTLMRITAEHPELVSGPTEEMFDGKGHLVLVLAGGPRPVRLFVDPETSLLSKAETVEDDPVYGDVLFEVVYEDWRRVDGVAFPFRVEHRLGGVAFQTEERRHIEIDVPVADDAFEVPDTIRVPYDPADGKRGELASQWFLRFPAMGFNLYDNPGRSVEFTEIGQGVNYVTGGTHHSMVIEMVDHLVAVEAPLSEERSAAVISAISARWPDKPIRYIVTTHFHFDHVGGTRTYAAEGATVVTAGVNRDHFERMLAAPHTVRPDALQRNPQPVRIETVPAADNKTLSDGFTDIEIYPVRPNSHSEGSLAIYLPHEKLLFISDLFQTKAPQAGPPGLWASELLASIKGHGLNVERLAGGHGMGVASMDDLREAAESQPENAAP